MSPEFTAMCRLHARLPAFRAKVERAHRVTQTFLDAAHRPYVAVSGGKDSTVCLSIARAIRSDVAAVLSHDQWLLPETEDYIRSIPDLTIIAGPHTHDGGVRTWASGRPDDPRLTWIDCDSHPLETYVERQGFGGVIIGLRAEENGYRKRHIRAKGVLFERVDGRLQCYPIAGWTDRDVWAYILSTGTPYNRAYDRMEALKMPIREWRVGPWWNSRAISGGSIERLREGWPSVYTRFRQEALTL